MMNSRIAFCEVRVLEIHLVVYRSYNEFYVR